MHPPLGHVVLSLHRIPIGHANHGEVRVLEERIDDQISRPGRCRPVDFSRFGADLVEHVLQRIGPERRRRANRDERGTDARDRREIIRIVRQFVVKIGMPGKRRRGRKKQRVVVARAGEGGQGDETVATRPVFHHHGLAPLCRELFGDQACPNVGTGAGTDREQEFHRPRRPILRAGRCGRYNPSKCRQKQCPNRTGTLHCRHGFFPVSRSCVASRPYPPKKSSPIRHKL